MFDRYISLVKIVSATKEIACILKKEDYFECLREIEYDMKFNGLAIELESVEEEKFTYIYNIKTCKVRSEIKKYKEKSMSEIIKEIKKKKQIIEKPNLLIMKKPDGADKSETAYK